MSTFKITSYSSGCGALDFFFETERTHASPPTLEQVKESAAWKELQNNKLWDWILLNIGSDKNPRVIAFSPCRRIDHQTIRTYAYERVYDCRYERDGLFNFKFFRVSNGHEVANWNMRGIMKFFLDHEDICTPALADRDAYEDANHITHLIPVVQPEMEYAI